MNRFLPYFSWSEHRTSHVIGRLTVCLLLLTLTCCHWPKKSAPAVSSVKVATKQKGMHVFGPLDTMSLEVLSVINVEWITLVPFGSQADYDAEEVRSSRSDSQSYIDQRNQRWVQQISLARQLGFKVMVKPHIWMHEPSNGKWRSDIYPASAEAWQTWQDSYRKFIIRWATVAEAGKADLFCIGTELTRLSLEHPEFWTALIQELKGIFSGELTYAANWYKEYEGIQFWNQLDYIGVQAYFPLSKEEAPSAKVITEHWQPHIAKLSAISDKYHKPILFTEIGYKSTMDATVRPWEWVDYMADSTKQLSYQTQVNAYQAVFESVWDMPWFAGMHIWQWRTNDRGRRGVSQLDFSPKDKPAQDVIQAAYSNAPTPNKL